MLYYSELLNKTFNSADECVDAENAYNKAQEEKAKVEAEKAAIEAEKKSKISAKKKEMAKAIEDAETKITEAEAEYMKAKKEAAEYIANARKIASEKLREAENVLNAAYTEKYNKVKEFNQEFGPYSVTYTGDKAYKEFARMNDSLASAWDKLFNLFF